MTKKSISASIISTLFILLAGCASRGGVSTSPHHYSKTKSVWTACDGCAQPESAYFDPTTGNLFVSNVIGSPVEKDGKGSIQKRSADGKVISAQWVTGLNSPKGLRSEGGKLYVADIDEIVVIDISSGKVLKRAVAKGATMLNDIAVAKGKVYASDTLGSKIFVWDQKSAPKEFLSGPSIQAPNGLLVDGQELVVAAWGMPEKDWSTKVPGNLLAIQLNTKKIRSITKSPTGNLDGLEKKADGKYLVSDWMAGKVLEISADGAVSTILDGFKGAADIGWRESDKTLVVPRMGEDQVTAFQL